MGEGSPLDIGPKYLVLIKGLHLHRSLTAMFTPIYRPLKLPDVCAKYECKMKAKAVCLRIYPQILHAQVQVMSTKNQCPLDRHCTM